MNTERNLCGENAMNISKSDLLKKIQALDFAKVETELYLDAHPNCTAALDYYKELCAEYDKLLKIYENTAQPITHRGSAGDTWMWVDMPWPWQNEEV